MAQVLHIANGKTLNEKLSDSKNAIGGLLASGIAASALVDEIYLSCLSRFPTDRERENLTGILDQAETAEYRQVVEDIYWAILSSREFLFNH